MNSPASQTAPGASGLDDARHLVPAVGVTLAVSVVVAPIAFWQYGGAGLTVVAAGLATIVVSFAVAGWAVKILSARGATASGVLAATGLRMVLPLCLALALVVGETPTLPARAVLYLVPLYLVMLCADTLFAARRCGEAQGQADVDRG